MFKKKNSERSEWLVGLSTSTDRYVVDIAAQNTEPDHDSFIRFVETLTIITQDRGKQPLLFNDAQKHIWNLILAAWDAKNWTKKKPWFICLKSRREGVSTLIEAILFAKAFLYPAKYCLVAAHKWDTSDTIFKMTRIMYDELPLGRRKDRPLESRTHRTLQWASPWHSSCKVATAGNETLASGDKIDYFHASEVGKMDDPIDALTSVNQCIPKHWDTLSFYESTAKGRNFFFSEWDRSIKGKSGFTPIFLTWLKKRTHVFDGPTPKLTKEEREFVENEGVPKYQWRWYVEVKDTYCHGRQDEFNQEYPVRPELAFKFSGYPWYNQNSITWHYKQTKDPVAIGRIVWESESDPVVKFEEEPHGALEIYEWPEKNEHYVIGGDIGQGVGAAYTVYHVLKIPRNSSLPSVQVAKFRSNRLHISNSGVEAFKLGVLYNWALIGIECNNHGHTTLSHLSTGHGQFRQMKRGYPDIYRHIALDRATQKPEQRLGWYTGRKGRQDIFHLSQEKLDDKLVIIRSAYTVEEHESIQMDVVNDNWVQERIDEETQLPLDDEVLSLGIALQMARHFRKNRALPPPKDGGY